MSLRIDISGFDLARWRGVFGCRDQSLLAQMLGQLEGLRAENRADVALILERAVRDGVPFSDVEAEGHLHALAADVVAQRQTLLPVESGGWPVKALAALANGFPQLAIAGSAFRFLIEGRPVFGTSVDTTWSHYAWLERGEVATLHRDMKALSLQIPPPTTVSERPVLTAELMAEAQSVSNEGEFGVLLERLVPFADAGVTLAFSTAERLFGVGKAPASFRAYQRAVSAAYHQRDPYQGPRLLVADLLGCMDHLLAKDVDLWAFAS